MPIPKKKPVTKKVEEEVLDLENDEILEEDEVIDDVEELEEDVIEEEISETEDEEDVIEEEISETEDEEDVIEEEEEEEPKPVKKVVKKTSTKKTVPAKKATTKETKAIKKTAPAKKATKPVKKVAEKTAKEERKLTKDDLIKAKKILNANAVDVFNETVESGKFEVDFGDKTSATRNDFVKMFITNVHEILNNSEDEGKSKHVTQLLNLNNITIANCETLVGAFEKTFMDLVEKQMTFVFGYNPSTNGITSIKRRTIMGRAFNSLDKTPSYTPFYATMKLEYPVGKEVIKGEYDAAKNIFTDENGKKHDIDKENNAAIAKDKKEFARNYPSHLTKK